MPEQLPKKNPTEISPQKPSLYSESDREIIYRLISKIPFKIPGGGSTGMPKSNSDKPDRTLAWTSEINVDLNNPLVEINIDSDAWATFFINQCQETNDKLPEIGCVLSGSAQNISISFNTYRNKFTFVVMPSFLARHSGLSGSRECNESILKYLYTNSETLQLQNLISYDQTCARYLLTLPISTEDLNSLKKEIESLRKALATVLEVIMRSVKMTEKKTINVPKPIIKVSEGSGNKGLSDRQIGKEIVKGLEVEDVKERLSDMGGNEELKKQIERLVAQYENSDFFEKRGVSVPKGILLYGPPGTGKTLSAKIFAGEIGRKFYHIKSSDILSKYYGESEQAVKDIFEHVEGPCIIFIDEIDSIAEQREHVSEPTRRVLAELLQQIDGLKSRKDIVILAATNRKESLDPAILRAGRFDRHILVDVPDEPSRVQIWNIHIQKQRQNSQVDVFGHELDITKLAKETEGLVGADIEEIIRRVKEKIVFESFEQNNDGSLITTDILLSETRIYTSERQKQKKDENERFGFHSSPKGGNK